MYVHTAAYHKTVCSPTPVERGPALPPDRAAERGSAPQADPDLCSGRLWENHARRRMGRRVRAAGRLAVVGCRGERRGTLSDVSCRCGADDCTDAWRGSDG